MPLYLQAFPQVFPRAFQQPCRPFLFCLSFLSSSFLLPLSSFLSLRRPSYALRIPSMARCGDNRRRGEPLRQLPPAQTQADKLFVSALQSWVPLLFFSRAARPVAVRSRCS